MSKRESSVRTRPLRTTNAAASRVVAMAVRRLVPGLRRFVPMRWIARLIGGIFAPRIAVAPHDTHPETR